MIQDIKIRELSATEELCISHTITIPKRFLEKLKWSEDHCIKLILDQKNNQIVIVQSKKKVKNNLKPLISKEQFYIIEQHELGKTFPEIARELDLNAHNIKLKYEVACDVLIDYLNKRYKRSQVGLPKNFVIPSNIIEQAEKIRNQIKNEKKTIKVLSEKKAFILEQRAEGRSYTAISKDLELSVSSVRDAFYRASRYVSEYLAGQIELEMPKDFIISDEIREAINNRLHIKL